MNTVRDTHKRLWQGTLAALLLTLVLFGEAMIGSEREHPTRSFAASCDDCFDSARAGASRSAAF